MINLIVGYFIILNIIGISFIWIRIKTDFIKLSEGKVDLIFILISMLGGFIGILVGAEMFQYEDKNKIFKIWIPFIVFVEICIILYIVYKNIH